MILGKISGKHTTTEFRFKVDGNPNKFDFVQIMHSDYGFVLAQIVSLVRDEEKTEAKCRVIGYKGEDGRIRPVRKPFTPGTEVLLAEDDFIKDMVELTEEKGAFLGYLENKKIPVHVDLRKLLTKHVAVLAKSGAGKSYTVGVLLEEIMEKRVPLLIIDPHGEYAMMKNPNTDEKEKLAKFGIKPRNFFRTIQEYGVDNDLKPLILNDTLAGPEIIQLLPTKLSNSQTTLLYTVLKNMQKVTFETLVEELERAENNAKWNLISVIDYLRKLKLFGPNFTPYNELIAPGKASIINLRGVPPDIQGIVTYKLAKDLFEERKRGNVPPFFMVIEEAHNFAPERGFGEAKPSKVLRTIASEGRKFGLGLCVVTQRPARLDKSVLSQVTTQLILKVTNPNDLKALTNSIEGLTQDSEGEIQALPIGTAMVTGVVDLPLLVNIRPRKTQHGGHAVDILEEVDNDKYFEELQEFENKDILAIIKPKITIKELEIMSEHKIKKIMTHLIPCVKILCERRGIQFHLLIERVKGTIVVDVDDNSPTPLPNLNGLTTDELKVLDAALHVKTFTPTQIQKKTSLSAVKTTINKLVRKSLILEENKEREQYIVPPYLEILVKPKQFETHVKIDYNSVAYDKKLEPKFPLEEIKSRLNRFLDVKDMKECHAIHYKVIHEK